MFSYLRRPRLPIVPGNSLILAIDELFVSDELPASRHHYLRLHPLVRPYLTLQTAGRVKDLCGLRLRASKRAHPLTTESEGIPATGLGDTMFVCVVGSGYVGLVTGTCLAEIGHNVICIDVDEQKIARLKQSQVPIYEPGIQELILTNQALGRLSFSGDISDAAERGCDFYFFAVGTPPRAEDGGADLTQVFAAVEVTAQALARQGNVAQRFAVFVTKSTVPVGTSREVARIVARHLPEEQFAV